MWRTCGCLREAPHAAHIRDEVGEEVGWGKANASHRYSLPLLLQRLPHQSPVTAEWRCGAHDRSPWKPVASAGRQTQTANGCRLRLRERREHLEQAHYASEKVGK